MSLWLCLRFDQLPLQCLSRSEEAPVVVLAAQRVVRANNCAAVLGIRPDMGTATVRALAGDDPVQLLERDVQAEARCLQQLCCWAYSITPSLHTWREDSLLLEIGSCLNLYRGLDSLLAEVASNIGSRGYRARYGLAPTPKAAWLLSFSDDNTAMCLATPLTARLAPLPLSLLADFSNSVDSLRRAGLHTLGDVIDLPASALGRRCGREFTLFLQQVQGQRADLQADYHPPAAFSDEYWFGYEVRTNDELLPAVQQLLKSLCHFLRNTQLQTSEISWQLIGIDNRLRDVRVRSTSSHSDWHKWFELSCIRFAQLQLDNSVEGLTLNCEQLRAGQAENIDMFSPGNQREPLATLLDRLRSRLGLGAVEKIGCRDEHLPELAVLTGSDHPGAPTPGAPTPGAPTPGAQRPFWLLPEPQALQLRNGRLYWNGALQLVYGPERIEDNWWRQAASRDYYIAANGSDGHYWVFRDRMAGAWYIHGIFT